MAQKRKNEISCMNVLLCLFVIYIHVISPSVSALEKGTVGYNLAMFSWRAVSFVVPGFILLSGLKLFLTKKDEKSYLQYLKSRFFAIFVPYSIAFAVYYGLFMYTAGYPLDIVLILKNFVTGSACYHLYFLIILFQFDLLFPLWRLIVNKCSPILAVPFGLIVMMIFEKWSSEMIRLSGLSEMGLMPDRMVMTYIGYWLLGCYIGKYYDKFAELLDKSFKSICVMFGVSFALFLHYTYIAFNYIEWVQFINEIHTLYSITVIIFLYSMFLKIRDKMPKVLSLIDGASFDIYLYHALFLYAAESLLSRLGISNQLLAFGVRALFGYALSIPLCILFAKLKKKIKTKIKPQT